MWDFRVFDAAIAALGPSLHNERGRLHRTLDESVSHAMRVWTSKYGPLCFEQETYAAAVLVGCIRSACRDSEGGHPIPLIKYRMGQAVNHEVTHAGFLRRKPVSLTPQERMAELELVAA